MEPFQAVDISSSAAMRHFADRFDIIVSKHATMHAPLAAIPLFLANWNALGAAYLLIDNWPNGKHGTYEHTRSNGKDIQWGDYRLVDLHRPPFGLGAPVCARVDAGLCKAHGVCHSVLELYALPTTTLTVMIDQGSRGPSINCMKPIGYSQRTKCLEVAAAPACPVAV